MSVRETLSDSNTFFGAVTMLSDGSIRDDSVLVCRNGVAGPVIQVALGRGLD
jgi:hypothetical protein